MAISSCILNIRRPSFGVQFHQTSRFFRVVAVPVHGTSATTASNPGGGIRPRWRPSCCVMTMLAKLNRLRLLTSMLSRPDTGSLATTTPFGWRASAICVALEPGAAQRSKARVSCVKSSSWTGSILAASCRVMRPVSCKRAIIRCAIPSGALPRANGMTQPDSSGIQERGLPPSCFICSSVHSRSDRWTEMRRVSGSGERADAIHGSGSTPKCLTMDVKAQVAA